MWLGAYDVTGSANPNAKALVLKEPGLLSPTVFEYRSTPEICTELGQQRDDRLHQLEGSARELHSHGTPILEEYLHEAFYFVPMLLGLKLTEGGAYKEALDWLQTVYDFNGDPGERKIAYLLRENHNAFGSYDRHVDWLEDPLVPHAIGRTRPDAYLRYTVQSIIETFLSYADASFAKDDVESIELAREFYREALELLALGSVNVTGCSRVIDLQALVEAGAPGEEAVRVQAVDVLAKLRNQPLVFDQYYNAITAELDSSRPLRDRIREAGKLIAQASQTAPVEQTVAQKRDQSQTLTRRYAIAALGDTSVGESAMKVANHTAADFEQGFVQITGQTTTDVETAGTLVDWLTNPSATVDMSSGLIQWVDVQQQAFNLPSDAVKFRDIADYSQPATFAMSGSLSGGGTVSFCVPKNPTMAALRLRADANLWKIRNGRNLAGESRPLAPYSTSTGVDAGMLTTVDGSSLPTVADVPSAPSAYRFATLIQRARQLADLAAQAEARFLQLLETRDAQKYQLLQARQDVELTDEQVHLQDLRIDEVDEETALAKLQRERAQIRQDTYGKWIQQGKLPMQEQLKAAYFKLAMAQSEQASASATLAIAGASPVNAALVGVASLMENFAQNKVIGAQLNLSTLQLQADFARQKRQWQLQKKLADKDVQISQQQITIDRARRSVVSQERNIAQLQSQHAQAKVGFLEEKFTNVELYDWMISVLRGLYAGFSAASHGLRPHGRSPVGVRAPDAARLHRCDSQRLLDGPIVVARGSARRAIGQASGSDRLDAPAVGYRDARDAQHRDQSTQETVAEGRLAGA